MDVLCSIKLCIQKKLSFTENQRPGKKFTIHISVKGLVSKICKEIVQPMTEGQMSQFENGQKI